MENDFRIKKINAKEEVEFHKKEINAIILAETKGEDISLLTATTMKMNSKYCKPSPLLLWKMKNKGKMETKKACS